MLDFLGLPVDASAHGIEIDNMMAIVHWLMLVLFVGWGAFFTFTVVRFRRSRNARADHAGVKSHASSYLEVAVAIFEVILIIGFAVPLWAKRVNAFPAEQNSLVVRVVAEQFAWNVHYPGTDGVFGRTEIELVSADNPIGLDRTDPNGADDIVTINQLNVPIGRPVIIYLSSKDVIHSFGVPMLRVKQDAIPGQTIPLWFEATKTQSEIREELKRSYWIGPEEIPVARSLGRTALEEYVAGDVTVAVGDVLLEEAIEALQQAGIRSVKVVPNLLGMVAMEDIVGSDEYPIVAKGDPVNETVILAMTVAGKSTILAAPEIPMEIACAQLCGLGHYRMRGYMTTMTPAEFSAWLEDEASYL